MTESPSSSPDTEPLLRLRGVHKRFGDFVALESMDLDVMPHEFFTILGPSGCGKSTLLRLIGGFDQPTSGSISSGGVDLQGEPPERRPFNTVFQSYALFPHMSVRENVGYGLRVAGIAKSEARRRVGEALRMVHLEQLAERKPPTLSGGQRQRAALARALVNEPSILLLDEPLGALDLKMRQRLQLELRAIQHRLGTTFVYVTHDQEEAMSLSDRICVMQNGAIAQIGTPQDLYCRPQSRYVADFIGTANQLSCRVVGRRDDRWEVELDAGGRAVLACFAEDEPRIGERMVAVIRPHDLEFAGGDERSFGGSLADVVFLGPEVRYTVRLANGETLDIRHRREGMVPAGADDVRVMVSDGAGVLVAAGDDDGRDHAEPATEPGRLQEAVA